MKRLTSNNYWEMGVHQMALNQAYIGDGGWAWYRNAPEDEISVCDLIRNAAEALDVELPILRDDDLSDLLTDWLYYGVEVPEGVLAVLYRALWAMAELRERLCRYENTGLEPEEVKKIYGDFVDQCVAEEENDPPNSPLTLEELREMDRDWVWVERLGKYSEGIKKYINGFGLVLVAEGYVRVIEMKFPINGYEKTWLAYRRKPEEGMT